MKWTELTPVQKAAFLDQFSAVCYQAYAHYVNSQGGETVPVRWELLKAHQKRYASYGIHWLLENPNASAEDSHAAWVERMIGAGWVIGPVKDFALKTHPDLVPFDQLTPMNQYKEHATRAMTFALADVHLTNFRG